MSPVYVDSGGFFAHLIPTDLHHIRATAAIRRCLETGRPLVSTRAVILETHALLLNRARNGEAIGLKFLTDLPRVLGRIEPVTSADERAARDLLKRTRGQGLTLCDALSVCVMDRRHIRFAISFDHHFTRRYALP